MNQIFTPFESQFVEQDRQNLEVIVLFVTYYVNHLVDRIILETKLSCTDILSHVYGSTVSTEQQLVIQTFSGQVSPYGTIFFAEEETFFEAFHYLFLTFQISL